MLNEVIIINDAEKKVQREKNTLYLHQKQSHRFRVTSFRKSYYYLPKQVTVILFAVTDCNRHMLKK